MGCNYPIFEALPQFYRAYSYLVSCSKTPNSFCPDRSLQSISLQSNSSSSQTPTHISSVSFSKGQNHEYSISTSALSLPSNKSLHPPDSSPRIPLFFFFVPSSDNILMSFTKFLSLHLKDLLPIFQNPSLPLCSCQAFFLKDLLPIFQNLSFPLCSCQAFFLKTCCHYFIFSAKIP